MTDADVIVVGAGPTGLMLACELGLAGVQALVLERLPRIRDVPKAGGLSGQIWSCCASEASWSDSKRPVLPPSRPPGCRGAGCTWTSLHWRIRR